MGIKFEGNNTFKVLTVQSLPMAVAYILTASSSLIGYALLKGMPDMSVYAQAVAGYAAILVIRNILAGVFDGFFTAGTVMVAEAYGRQDHVRAWSVSVHMIALCVMLGLALSAAMLIVGRPLLDFCTSDPEAATLVEPVFAFLMLTTPLWIVGMMLALLLRGVGDVRYSSAMNGINAFVFVGLSAILIPMFGVMGAAIASVTAFGLVNTAVYLTVILSSKSAIRPGPIPKLDMSIVKEAVKLAWPISLRTLVDQAGFAVVISSISSFGVVFLAAWQTSKDVISFGCAPGNAAYATSSAIVAARQGVRENGDATEDLRKCIIGFLQYALVVSTVVAVLLIGASAFLPGWLTNDPDIADVIGEMIPIFVATVVVGNIGSVLSGTLQGIKRTKSVALVSITSAVAFCWAYPAIIVALGGSYLVVIAFNFFQALMKCIWYSAILRKVIC